MKRTTMKMMSAAALAVMTACAMASASMPLEAYAAKNAVSSAADAANTAGNAISALIEDEDGSYERTMWIVEKKDGLIYAYDKIEFEVEDGEIDARSIEVKQKSLGYTPDGWSVVADEGDTVVIKTNWYFGLEVSIPLKIFEKSITIGSEWEIRYELDSSGKVTRISKKKV